MLFQCRNAQLRASSTKNMMLLIWNRLDIVTDPLAAHGAVWTWWEYWGKQRARSAEELTSDYALQPSLEWPPDLKQWGCIPAAAAAAAATRVCSLRIDNLSVESTEHFPLRADSLATEQGNGHCPSMLLSCFHMHVLWELGELCKHSLWWRSPIIMENTKLQNEKA